jgi:NAD(P)H-nitrite reductase large subunit
MAKYVIIGNSAAAIGAVEGIREVDKLGDITVVSKEKYHTYSRPLISYLLQGKTTLQNMKYRSDSFYADNKVNFICAEALKIDAEKKIVITSIGETKYEKLLIATGSKPFVPNFEGLDNVRTKFTFMSLDDALALNEKLTPDSRVLIIGAGLIGLKCAEALAKRAGGITVTDLADQVMPSVLDKECSAIVKKVIENNGIKFLLGDSVIRFEENKAYMKSGAEIEFDILVIAAGVRPNVELLENIAQINRGIIIDETCKTTADFIYAAGDCVLSYDITSEQTKILALLPNAYIQGFCAGVNMAGGYKSYKNAFPMNAIGFFGYHILSAGSIVGESYVESDGENYKRLFYKDDRLKGFILAGNIQKAGIYTSLIREQTPLSEIDFELIKKYPTLAAFGLYKIKKCLGEEV